MGAARGHGTAGFRTSRHIRRMLSSRGTKAGPTKDRDSLDKALSKISRILITRTFSMHKD